MTADLNFVGKIRCPLYDTISVTSAERVVIDHPSFQRLRRLRQTAFTHYVFPGATHTRFEHSLGVMHMAGIFLSTMMKNQQFLLGSSSLGVPELESTIGALKTLEGSRWLAQVVRFAGMLHDLGHAPFSHSGERFLVTWAQVENGLSILGETDWLIKTVQKKINRLKISGSTQALEQKVNHEFYSLLLIESLFRKFTEEFLNPAMAQDICCLLDKDVPIRELSPLGEHGVRSLLAEIISGEIDADRMDYLCRDAQHCGVVYGLFDASRLLDAAVFYKNQDTGALCLALHRSGLAAYEDFLRARMSMYQQVYFHKTGTACEAMLAHIQRKIPQFTLPLNPQEYLEYDDSSFLFLLHGAYPTSTDLHEDLQDLLLHRKLWKRVYEESHARIKFPSTPSLTPAALGLLRRNGVSCELIESETNLSRFSPKGRTSGKTTGLREQQGNSLKIVVKDVRNQRSLQPIEDHSRLINNLDEERVLQRIFVKAKGPEEVSAIQESIANLFSGSPM